MQDYKIYIDPADQKRFQYWMDQQLDDEVIVIQPVGSFTCDDRNLAPKNYLGGVIRMDGMTYVSFRAALPRLRGYTQERVEQIHQEKAERTVTMSEDGEDLVLRNNKGEIVHRITKEERDAAKAKAEEKNDE